MTPLDLLEPLGPDPLLVERQRAGHDEAIAYLIFLGAVALTPASPPQPSPSVTPTVTIAPTPSLAPFPLDPLSLGTTIGRLGSTGCTTIRQRECRNCLLIED